MTKLVRGAILALLFLVPLALPLADAAPTTFTVNVVSARSLGCSPDFFTSPDLRVRVLVDGAVVATTEKAQDRDEPLFGFTVQATANLPATIGIEVDEAEPSGLFGTSWVACAVAPGNATRANVVYRGEAALPATVRGDGSNAAEATIVIGPQPPATPSLRAAEIGPDYVILAWTTDGTGQATGHRIATGGFGAPLSGSGSGNAARVGGLCDNHPYTLRVVRDATAWHVASADTTFTTTNVAPDAASVLSATRAGNVSFESPTTHDIARYEIHASGSASFAPGDATLRKIVTPVSSSFARTDETAVPFRSSDTHVVVRSVDTREASAVSAAFAIDAPARGGTLSFTRSCAPGTVTAATAPGGSEPVTVNPTPSPTPTQPTPTPTPTPTSPPPAEPACCYQVALSIDVMGDGLHWPRVRAGGSVNVTVSNAGSEDVQLELVVVDRSGAIAFVPGPFVRAAAGASVTVPMLVSALPGAPAQEGVNAAIEATAHTPGVTGTIQGAALLVDVPSSVPAATLAAVVDVKVEGGTVRLAPGGRAEATFLLVNRGPTSVTVETILTSAFREDADIGRTVAAPGFAATPATTRVTLEAYSKQEVRVTLQAPPDATIGEEVTALVRLQGSDGARSEELAAAQFTMQVQPPVAVTAGPGMRGVGYGLAAAGVGGGLAAALWLRRDAARYAVGVALYSRLARSQLLEHGARDDLLARIAREPGICYTDLKRATGMNTGALVHHLRALERGAYVTSRKEGSFRRFYAAGEAPLQVVVHAAPRLTPMQARVVEALREAPLTQGELAARLGLSQQGTSHHVKALERAGHVVAEHDGRAWRYHVVETHEVVR